MPYFTTEDGIPIADGLAFSTKTKKESPSLTVLYNAIEDDVYKGTNFTMARNPNLKFLADQGVLLLNSALTCEPNMPTIHIKLWQPFMKFFFEEIINKHFSDLHIIFFGEEAMQYRKYVEETHEGMLGFENSHYIYDEHHPAYLARTGERMQTNIFSKINERLRNDVEKPIFWDENVEDESQLDSLPMLHRSHVQAGKMYSLHSLRKRETGIILCSKTGELIGCGVNFNGGFSVHGTHWCGASTDEELIITVATKEQCEKLNKFIENAKIKK